MVTISDLDPEIASVGTALGILSPVVGGHRLVEDFFIKPWDKVAGLVSSDVQRAALVESLEALLPSNVPDVLPSQPRLAFGASGGTSQGVRVCHPLLQPGGKGQIYIVADRDGPAAGAAMRLGLAAEASVGAGGPGAVAELTLLEASGGAVLPVAGSPDYPLRLHVRVPLGEGPAAPTAVAAVQLIAPPHADSSRISVELHGLPANRPPLVLDPAGGEGVAELALTLVRVALDLLGAGVPAEVRAVADNLPGLLGLDGGLPPLPIGDLASDPSALRAWLAGLLTKSSDAGIPALLTWLNAIAGLIGAPPATSAAMPSEDDPMVLPLLGGPPSVAATVGVRSDAATGDPVLLLGLRIDYPSSAGLDAVLRVDALLLTVPLTGTTPSTIIERLDVVVQTPTGTSPLIPSAADAASAFGVGRLRAGIRHRAGERPMPLLELDAVTVDLGGTVRTFDHLDLTDATALSGAAESVLDAAIADGLGSGAAVVDALRTLLGIGTTPGIDLGHFAGAPTRALAEYVRQLRGTSDGWRGLVNAVATLLGNTGGSVAAVGGDGTPAAPWRAPLELFQPAAGSDAQLSLLVWDDGDDSAPTMHLGLGLDVPAGTVADGRWQITGLVEILAVSLPSSGAGSVRWLGGVAANARCAPGTAGAVVGGVGFGADSVALDIRWAPGQPLSVDAQIAAAYVDIEGEHLDLGELRWPAPGGLDLTATDLGLGLDPQRLWSALRPLVVRYAAGAGGPAVRDLLALVGIVGPGSTEDARRLPPLEIGAGGLPDLLAQPLEAVRAWLYGLASDAASAVGGVPHIVPLLRALQAVLTGRTPALSGSPTPAPDLPVHGVGTPDQPWVVPLHAPGEAAVELVGWLEPDGPPIAWALERIAALSIGDEGGTADEVDDTSDTQDGSSTATRPIIGADLRAAIDDAGGYLTGAIAATAAGSDLFALAIDAVAEQVLSGDGIVDIGDVLAAENHEGWQVADPLDAAHHLLPVAAAAIVTATVSELTQGLTDNDWAVLLLAPSLAGPEPWAAVLEGADPTTITSTSLRMPGVDPDQVDLGGVPPASWYVVDLGDDGTSSDAKALSSLARVVDAVRREKPTAKVILVAHSYLGALARAQVDAKPETILGLVTIGCPVTGQTVDLADPLTAEGARLVAALAPDGLPGTESAQDAITLLTSLLDGYSAQPGRPPTRTPVPVQAYGRFADKALELHGVPALAVPGQVTGDVRVGLARAFRLAVLESASAQEVPTHVAWGVRAGLDLGPAKDGDPDVEVSALLELGRVRLTPAAVSPDRSPRLQISARVHRLGGWIVGGAGDGTSQESRVRSLDLTATVAAGTTAPVTEINVALHDVALRGDAATLIRLDDARAADLLDRVVKVLDVKGVAGGRLDALLGALSDLGVIRRRTDSSAAAVLADGLSGLRTDANSWCAQRLPPLLDRSTGLLGLIRSPGTPAEGGPWRVRHVRLPVEVVVDTAPWRLTVRTTGDGLQLGAGVALTSTGIVDLATLTPTVDAAMNAGGLQLTGVPGGGMTVTGSWLDTPLHLPGASPDEVLDRLGPLLPRLLLSAALGSVLEDIAGQPIADLGLLLADPGRWVARALGADGSSSPGLPDAARLEELLRLLATEAGLDSGTGGALTLPGGIAVAAEPNGVGLRLSARTAAPIQLWSAAGGDASLSADLHLDVDSARQVTPGGDLTLHLPLPGDWATIDVHLGASATGAAAAVDITFQPPSTGGTPQTVTVQLLPSTSGLDALAGAAAERLLPAVLDGIVTTIGARTPTPPVLAEVLDVADVLGIHDPTGGFAAKAAELASLVGDMQSGGAQAGAATAIDVVLRRLLGSALVPPSTGPGLVKIVIPLGAGGDIELTADLSAAPPSIQVSVSDLTVGALGLGLTAGYIHPDVVARADVTLTVDTRLGVVLTPMLHAGVAGGGGDPRLAVELRPLGNAAVIVALAPVAASPSFDDLVRLGEAWVLPLVTSLALRASSALLERPMWPAGKAAADVLLAANAVVRAGDGSLQPVAVLPTPAQLFHGALDSLVGVSVPLPGGASLRLATDGALYGLVVGGEVNIPAGELAVGVRFGLPGSLDVGWGDAGQGVGLLLLDLTDPTEPAVTPVLRLGGLGMRLSRSVADKPLLDTGGFRLGAVAAHIRTDLSLTGTAALRRPAALDGAVALEGLGLPFAAGNNSANPVAGSLLQHDPSGDAAPVNPPVNMLVGRGGGGWTVQFSGKAEIRFEIHRSFGPLHIEELALLYVAAVSGTGPGSVGISVDGGVALAGLAVEVDDLTLLVPLRAPADIGQWQVDLAGLSLSLVAGPVAIAGGLLKSTLDDGTIDYEGMLSVDIAGRGLTAVGAYARPHDALGGYTSLFVFVSCPFPLGGPPYLFVLGLGGGAGYNRRLLVPRDPSGVPAFPLVAAIAGGGFSADGGPMAALQAISKDIPPARGAVWIAAGVKFSTFELLHTTAVAYVSIDHGLEVGLLGLMQMVLPADDAAVVSVELALAARYSTVDQILSVRAALTRNSWLISPDCQLTGGFAFVVWFGTPDVLLSVGGYGPLFTPPPQYPQVPAVGFHWAVGGGIVVKGQSYFTLTPAALMFGGRLEASYDVSPVRVWFTVHLDVLIIWDPFHYVLDAGVSVGASFTIKVCFFACVRISVSVTLSASVRLEGPPLHGTVTVDLAVARVTVEFGRQQPQAYLDWAAASLKYLGGGTGRPATTASVASGGRPPEGAGAPEGTEDRPWQVAPEFSVRVESVMPLRSWRLTGTSQTSGQGGAQVDVVPCGNKVGRVEAVLVINVERRTAPASWVPVPASQASALQAATDTAAFPASVWDAARAGHATSTSAMVRALSRVELATDVSITEATGALGEIPFSRLVEEESVRPLTFGASAVAVHDIPSVSASRSKSTAVAAVAPRLPVARRQHAPRLRAIVPMRPVLRPLRGSRQEVDINGSTTGPREAGDPSRPSEAVAERDDRAQLPQGGALVWDVDLTARHRVEVTREQGRTTPLRLVALTGTGALVADNAARGRMVVPDGASRVVVLAAADGVSGWDSATPLLPVGPSTLIAVGATVRLPRPWTPPARYARLGEYTRVPSGVVVASVDGVVTDLPPDVQAVSVLLDRVDPDAEISSTRVSLAGATPGRRRSAHVGPRAHVVVPVESLDAEATAISVTVETGPGWRLVGVHGHADAAAGDVARALREQPWWRLDVASPRGAPVNVGLTPLNTQRGT